MTDTLHTVIVVPCYNEATRLPIARFTEFAASHSAIGFLFVNDGSTDDTHAVLARLVATRPSQFAQLDLGINRGKAEAVRSGMLDALNRGAAYTGYWDADLATPLSEIPRFIDALTAHPSCSICFGSRVRLLGRQIERNRYRHYLGRMFATVASHVLKLAVYDTQCGAKLFRASDDTRELFAQPFCVNWTFDVEIVAREQARCIRQGLPDASSTIYELPLNEWRDVAGSKVVPSDFFHGLFEMWRIQRKYSRRRT